jgi:hypothetical protein
MQSIGPKLVCCRTTAQGCNDRLHLRSRWLYLLLASYVQTGIDLTPLCDLYRLTSSSSDPNFENIKGQEAYVETSALCPDAITGSAHNGGLVDMAGSDQAIPTSVVCSILTLYRLEGPV